MLDTINNSEVKVYHKYPVYQEECVHVNFCSIEEYKNRQICSRTWNNAVNTTNL